MALHAYATLVTPHPMRLTIFTRYLAGEKKKVGRKLEGNDMILNLDLLGVIFLKEKKGITLRVLLT